MTDPHRRAPLSVLVVDDHPDGGESTAYLLRLLGYEVRVARTAAEARGLAGSSPPDVAVLDIGLPDGDGYALARHLGGLPRRPLLVAVTGFGNTEAKAREAGFDHYFLKPADPAVLVDLLTLYAWDTGH